jgi:hypothetical protein
VWIGSFSRIRRLGRFNRLSRPIGSGMSALSELDAAFVGFLVFVGLGR